MTDRVYLDHAATTPLRPAAAEAMREGFALWANPSSPHTAGRAARAALEDARERIKAALGWDGEVIITSGASEAAAIALGMTPSTDNALISAVEHPAIEMAAYKPSTLPVLSDGSLDPFKLKAALSDKALIANVLEVGALDVAVQHVNSETGNRQDIDLIASVVHKANGTLIVDCAQSAGKFPLPGAADMVIVSAHKFGGPVGVGALLMRDFALLEPTGGQERGYRHGTENLPGALGMAAALEAADDPYLNPIVLASLESFAGEVRASGGEWLSDRLYDPTAYIRAIAMPHLSGQVQLMRFDMAGIAVSQGSACSSGSLRRSHVLQAMGIGTDLADRTIRVSLGWNTTVADIERFREVWLAMATDTR